MVFDASGDYRSPHVYQFDIRGPKAQPLGLVALPGDMEAIDFADRIILGLRRQDPDGYRGCTLAIAEDQRTVACVSI